VFSNQQLYPTNVTDRTGQTGETDRQDNRPHRANRFTKGRPKNRKLRAQAEMRGVKASRPDWPGGQNFGLGLVSLVSLNITDWSHCVAIRPGLQWHLLPF